MISIVSILDITKDQLYVLEDPRWACESRIAIRHVCCVPGKLALSNSCFSEYYFVLSNHIVGL